MTSDISCQQENKPLKKQATDFNKSNNRKHIHKKTV